MRSSFIPTYIFPRLNAKYSPSGAVCVCVCVCVCYCMYDLYDDTECSVLYVLSSNFLYFFLSRRVTLEETGGCGWSVILVLIKKLVYCAGFS